MVSLRLAVFAATCALLLAASAPLPPAEAAVQLDVGDETGWTMVPSAGDGTKETLTQWAGRQRFHVGDVLDFKSWDGLVLLLERRGDYERCGATGSPMGRFAGGGGAGFVLDQPGTFYFVSGVPGRCEAGERMAVRVSRAPFFAPTSGVAAPGPDAPGTTEAPPPPPPPPTVVFKLTPSAMLWIATVVIFAVILLGVIICCVNEQAKLTRAFIDSLATKVGHYKALSTELASVEGRD